MRNEKFNFTTLVGDINNQRYFNKSSLERKDKSCKRFNSTILIGEYKPRRGFNGSLLKLEYKCQRHFTLIELIIVIVVIGILAGMSLPKFTGVVRDAKVATMIRDKEVLEKALMVYQQDNDTLPLLNEDEELVSNAGISLIRMVSAETTSNDMNTIYESLQTTLKNYNDSEEYLYRIDLSKTKDYLSKDIKYGYKQSEKDFYVYSTKTGNVYYYDYLTNKDNEIFHNEYNTKRTITNLVNKTKSILLNTNKNTNKNTIDSPIIKIKNDNKDLPNLITDVEVEMKELDKKVIGYEWKLNNNTPTEEKPYIQGLPKGKNILKVRAIYENGEYSNWGSVTIDIEIRDAIPKMRTNIHSEGVVSASQVFSGDLRDTWMVFGKDYIYPTWATKNTKTGWLQFEFVTPRIITSYSFKNMWWDTVNATQGIVRDWNIEAYDEDTNSWVVLDMQRNHNNWDPKGGELRTFKFENNKEYKKYRINVFNNNGHIHLSLCDLRMYE